MSNADFLQPHIFTIEEATALLPQLRELVAMLRSARTRLAEGQRELRDRYHGGHGNGYPAPGGQLDRLQTELTQAQNELDEAARAISGFGCELKDPERGMVDFRAMRDGRVVYLCWLASEPAISYWHELDGGYAGRRPL